MPAPATQARCWSELPVPSTGDASLPQCVAGEAVGLLSSADTRIARPDREQTARNPPGGLLPRASARCAARRSPKGTPARSGEDSKPAACAPCTAGRSRSRTPEMVHRSPVHTLVGADAHRLPTHPALGVYGSQTACAGQKTLRPSGGMPGHTAPTRWRRTRCTALHPCHRGRP